MSLSPITLALTVLLAACGQKAQPTPSNVAPPPPECTAVISSYVARLPATDSNASLKTILTTRCTEDTWDADARTCIAAAGTEQQLKDCTYRHLSQEQSDKLSRAVNKVRVNDVVQKMATFADRICACADKPCAERVQDDMTKWATKMAETAANKDDRPDEETMKQMTDIGQRYGECLTKVMSTP